MRVALVCGSYEREHDGVADYAGMLAAALPGAGVHPVVMAARSPLLPTVDETPQPDGPPLVRAVDDSSQPDGSPLLCPAARWDVRGVAAVAAALARLGADGRIDAVHVQFAPSAYRFSPAVGLLPLLLRRAGCRLPLLTTLHEYGWWAWPHRLPGPLWDLVERRHWWDREAGLLTPLSAALIATTPGAAHLVRRRTGRSAQVVPIGPNVPDAGASRATARREVRAELGLPATATLLVFFGFVHPVKGVRYLLEALAALRQDRPDLHLVVAGGFASLALPGEEATSFRRELDGLARGCGVAQAVTFLGHRPATEVSRVLAAADVGVLPFTAGVTTKSGSLLALWAHRLPVVVTDVPEDAERDPEVLDGVSAVVVPARRDDAALADGLRRVLRDPGLAARVAEGGTQRVAARSWPRIAAAHAAVYADASGRAHVGARPGPHAGGSAGGRAGGRLPGDAGSGTR